MNNLTIAVTAYKRRSVIKAIIGIMELTTADAVVNFDILNSGVFKEAKSLEATWGSRLKVVESKSGGLSKSRNKLIKMVNSEYIMFLDDDDEITKSFGEWLCKNKIKDPVYRFDKINVYDESEEYIKGPKRICHSSMFHSLQISSYILRRDIYKCIEFPEGILSEDIFIAKDVFKMSQTQTCIPVPSIKYRVMGGDSITNNLSKEDYERTISFAASKEEYRDVAFVALWIAFSYTKSISKRDVKLMLKKYIPFWATFKILPIIYKIRMLVCL